MHVYTVQYVCVNSQGAATFSLLPLIPASPCPPGASLQVSQ